MVRYSAVFVRILKEEIDPMTDNLWTSAFKWDH
jgi:hypothetical protein